jgi:hypothetical protein
VPDFGKLKSGRLRENCIGRGRLGEASQKVGHGRTFLLKGLRFSDQVAILLLEGVQTMHESTTYRRIVNDGRLEEARRILIRLATKRFGEPDRATVAAVDAINDIERLEAIGERTLDVDIHDWNGLLGPT